MKLSLKPLIILFLFVVSCGTNNQLSTTKGKKNKSEEITIYNKENSGLKSERLAKITIDNQGNIWLGTMDNGLIKFDGEKFYNYNKSNSKVLGDYISDLKSDNNGNIWISYSQPQSGTIKFDGKNWTEFPNKNIPNLDFGAYPIGIDKKGNIYFCQLESNEITKYDGEKTTKIEIPKQKGQNVLAIDFDIKGNIAIGLTGSFIVRKNGKWKILTTENSELRLSTVRGVKFMKNGELFIGYGGGFGDGGFSILKDEKWKHFNKGNSIIPDHMVRDFEVDSFGNIWMATNNGVFEIEKGMIFKPILFREGFGMNTIMDIEIDKNNNVWLATTFGLIKLKQ